MNIKTVFTKNTQITQKKVMIASTVTTVITNPPPVIIEDLYLPLANYSQIINNLLLDFSLGNYKVVIGILTKKYYNFLSIKLYQIVYNEYPIYEQLRKTLRYSLQGLYKSIQQYNVLLQKTKQLTQMTEKASILDDINKLKIYVNGLKGTTNIFPDLNITAPLARIKPEYAEYIRLYGYPESGIFDMDLLAVILINMDLTNFI